MTELTCRDVVDFLMSYLARELDPSRRAEFEAHVALCDECVTFIRSYEATVRLGKSAFEQLDQPADTLVPHDLVEAILAARRK